MKKCIYFGFGVYCAFQMCPKITCLITLQLFCIVILQSCCSRKVFPQGPTQPDQMLFVYKKQSPTLRLHSLIKECLITQTTDGAAISQCVIFYWQKRTLISDCMLLTSKRSILFFGLLLWGIQVFIFYIKTIFIQFRFILFKCRQNSTINVLTFSLSANVSIAHVWQYSPREDVCW